MARPSRHLEALEVLRSYYREHGILPTVEGLARGMGYRSTSSAFKTLNHLVKEGYVSREPEGGRLLPGRKFRQGKRADAKPRGLPELGGKTIEQYLRGPDANLLTVVATKSLLPYGILKGDFLLVSTSTTPGDGHLVVGRRGKGVTVLSASESKAAGASAILGVLIAQFRKY